MDVHTQIEDDEFNIPENEYIQSHPVLQLKPEIYNVLPKDIEKHNIIINPNPNISQQLYLFNDLRIIEYPYEIKRLFTEDIVLNNSEYVVIVNINTFNSEYRYYLNNLNNLKKEYVIPYINKVEITYLTNYGRIIRKIYNLFLATETRIRGIITVKGYNNPNYDYWKIKVQDGKLYKIINYSGEIESGFPKPLDELKLPLLTYKMPKLFLDVLQAFRRGSTENMQECCRKYLYATRKTKDERQHYLDYNKEIRTRDEIIKSQEYELEVKTDLIISQGMEITKLKLEMMKIRDTISKLI
jgi:hypothetical protein